MTRTRQSNPSLKNDLLDISKIEAGKVELAIEEFLFPEVVEEALQSISCLIKEKGLELILDIQLPDINGYEATKRIRASIATVDIPIGYSDAGHGWFSALP